MEAAGGGAFSRAQGPEPPRPAAPQALDAPSLWQHAGPYGRAAAWLGALGLLLAPLLAAALRRRLDRLEALLGAVVAAPLLVGLLGAQRGQRWTGEALRAPLFCLDREAMLEAGLRDGELPLWLGAGAAALLLAQALLALRILRARERREGRGGQRPPEAPQPARAPGAPRASALLLGALLVALTGATWRLRSRREGLERWARRGLSDALGDPSAPRLPRPPLPPRLAAPADAPLILVSQDGALRYDDTRGLEPPGPLPASLRAAAPAQAEAPPFFVLAADAQTPWNTLDQALGPLAERGLRHHQLLVTGAKSGQLGALPVEAFRPTPRGKPASGGHDFSLVLSVIIDEQGLTFLDHSEVVDPRCERSDPEATALTLPRERGAIEAMNVRQCGSKIKARSPDFKDETRVWVIPLGATSYADVTLVVGALRETEDGEPLFPSASVGFAPWSEPGSTASATREALLASRPRRLSEQEAREAIQELLTLEEQRRSELRGRRTKPPRERGPGGHP